MFFDGLIQALLSLTDRPDPNRVKELADALGVEPQKIEEIVSRYKGGEFDQQG